MLSGFHINVVFYFIGATIFIFVQILILCCPRLATTWNPLRRSVPLLQLSIVSAFVFFLGGSVPCRRALICFFWREVPVIINGYKLRSNDVFLGSLMTHVFLFPSDVTTSSFYLSWSISSVFMIHSCLFHSKLSKVKYQILITSVLLGQVNSQYVLGIVINIFFSSVMSCFICSVFVGYFCSYFDIAAVIFHLQSLVIRNLNILSNYPSLDISMPSMIPREFNSIMFLLFTMVTISIKKGKYGRCP